MNLPPTVIGTAQLACKILEKIRPAMAAGRTSISDLENQVCCLINYLHMVKHNISFKSAIFSKTNSENTNFYVIFNTANEIRPAMTSTATFSQVIL